MMNLRKNAITIKRALLIFAIIIFVTTCIAGCGTVADTSDKTEGAAENRFRSQMADAGTTEIAVKKDLVLEAPVEINGTKVLYGEGSITAVGDGWAEDDYMIVVQPGAQLTVKGSVSINAGGVAGGIRAAQDAVWTIEETASVKNASATAANTLVEGAFHMNGGTLAGAMGHNVHNMGEVTVSEGEIIGSGAKHAGIYGEGKLTQNGGTIRDAYNNVVVLSGGSFHFNGGNNQDSIHDGIYIAEGAKLSVTAKSAVITGSGVRGIYLCGEATVDGITLNSSGDSLVKISQTGILNLNGGTLADAGYHSVENAGKMVMTGGSVRNSYNCGIVNSGTLEITGGSILDNANNKGVLNKHDGKATISGQTVMFSGNRIAVANEDTATLDLTGAEILLTTTTNVYAFDGQVNIHDISLGASGSNNVRIYKAEVTMNNVQVLGNSASGSSTTHGILLEGGVLNAKDVTIKNTTGYGIRNKGGHVTAENLLISKSIKAGGISSLLQDHTGAPGVMDIKNLTIEDIRYNNIVVEGGTVTVTDGHLAVSGTNNVKTTGGVLNLNNVDVLGNLPDTDGTNHAVYMTGGKIVANDVNISNARVSGLRINGETAVFTGNKVTIRNSGKYGIDQTIGKISVNNMTLTGNYYNVNNTKGYIGLSNSTLGPTVSNNLRSHGGTLELYNVAVNGHTENHVDNVHALFLSGGTLNGQNITVKDVSNAGLRVADGTANIQGLTVNDAGADGVWISKGEATISDLVIKKAGAAGVAATGTSSIAVIGGSIDNTVSHGAKSENEAKLTLEDISVAMPTTNGRHAVLAQGGDVHLEDVKITGITANTTGAGIRINKDTSHVTGKGVSIADVNTGISANAGTSDIYGVTTKGITGHSVYVSETAKIVISDSTFGVTGTNNAKAESKGTLTLNNVVIEGTKTNHGVMVENGGYVYGKNITVRNTAGCAVRVKTGSAGNNVEIDGLITENVGAQNIWINNGDGNVGSIVIKNGDLCRTGTHNVRVEAGNLTLIDTKIQGHTSGTKNDIHAIYVSNSAGKINLDGVTVLDAAGDALRIASGNVVAADFTSEKTGRNGVWINSGSLTAENLTVSGSKQIGVQVTGGTAVVNGANISGSANNVLVTGVELTINGYADGSKSQIGTSTKDNVVASDGAVIRLNDVNVLESKTNNIVATKGKVYLTDVTVTGGNYSVLVQDAGYAELNGVTITAPVSDAVRVNRADGKVVVNNVQINNPVRYGISIQKGTVDVKGTLTISSNANKSRGIYVYDGGKVTTAADAKVTISGTEYGIYADSNAIIDMSNVAISGCAKNSFNMTSGTAVLNGVNISGSSTNNILVSGGELTVNGYADNSKSQIGTAKEDNIKATGTGVVRLNNVNVLKSSKNNVVAITGGTVHMKDSAVTGGNHSVLADNTGTVYLTNVAIKDSSNSGIRANHSASFVEATGVTIDGAKTGLSISQGTVKITDITVRNTKEVGVSVAQSTSAANVTLNNLVAANCGTHAVYTSGASANLTVNGATLSNDGSHHVINLNGGPLVLNDVTVNGTNLAAGQYELYSGAGWLTIGGAMDADIYIATNPGRVIKVNKELTGNGLVVDWKNAPTGAALEFTSEAMMNDSRDNVRLGTTQTALDGRLYFYSGSGKGYAKLVNKVVTNETQLNEYLAYAASQNQKDVEILIGGSFEVANQVTIPAGIASLTIVDDGNTATTNVVTYNGSEKEIFVWNDCETLTLNGVTIDGNKKGNVNVPANTRLNMTDVTVKMPYDRGVQFSGAVHLSGTVNVDNADGNSTVWGISGAAGGVLTSDAGTVVNIKNAQYGFVANGGAKLTTDTLNVTNTANNAIYVDGSGSEMKVTTAVIDGTTKEAVYAKNGTLTIDDLSVSNHGSNSIRVLGGTVTVNKAELGGINKGVNNILVSSGSLTLKDATVGKNGQNNNICINGGTVNLHNVEVLGNDMTGGDGKHLLYANGTSKIISTGYLKLSDGSAAGIRMDGSAKLTAETVEIYGTDLYGIRNTGSSNFEAKNLTVGASATNDAPNIGIQSQAVNTVIKITESATLSAKNYNVVGDNGTIEINGATINKTTSNNVATSAGIIKLTNSTVLGHSASGNVHAVFGKGGDIVLDNVTISGAATAGIRINNANSTVTATSVTISDCAYAVTMNAGELILNNATITAATGKGIVVDGGKQSVSGKIVAEINYNNVATALNVTGALTDGSNLVVDWKNAPTGNALEFASADMMNASKDNITLGKTQTDAGMLLNYSGNVATLVGNVITGEAELNTYLDLAADQGKTAVTVKIGGNLNLANKLTIPAGITSLTIQDDGNTETVNTITGGANGLFEMHSGLNLTLENVVVGGTASAKAAHIIVPESATLTLRNATLQYFSGSQGGAVHVNNGTLIATGSTFANNSNTSDWGGAIGIWGGTVNISNSTFTGNTSKNSGGAIINYKADTNGVGTSKNGAVGTLTLTNCVFTNNTTSEHGGAVAAWSGGTTTITGCTFESNIAKTNGGAVHVRDGHTITIDNCTFTSNEATSSHGGALYYLGSKQLTVRNSTFTGNAGTEGGAISADGNLNVSGTKFISNRATTGGAGAVVIWNNRTFEFSNCEFIGNTAKANGGAIRKGGSAGGVLKITDCDFDGNSAPNGEGGVLMLQSSPTVTITGSTFTGNSAKTNGGVIKNNSSTTGMKIENSEFSNNTAGGNGGVLYQQDGNSADLINCTFAGNTAAAGNAVYSVGGTVNLTGGNVQETDCSGKFQIVKE